MPTLSTPSPRQSEPSRDGSLPLFPLLLILAPLLTRAAVGMTTLPAWDMDPLLYPLPVTVLTPAGSILIDSLVLLGAALTLLHSARRGDPIGRRPMLLAALGAIPVLLHGWFIGPHDGSLGDQRIGSAWLSAIFAGVAIAHAARDPRVLRVVAASFLGFLALLAVRALQQEFVDHPATVADFKQNRDRILAAHGWTAGSPSALAYERRALQPEAAGWFGLSNVFATLAAAGVVASLGLIWATAPRLLSVALPTTAHSNGDSGRIGAASSKSGETADSSLSPLSKLGIIALLAATSIALALSRSKGGILAAAAGIGALATFLALSRYAFKEPIRARRLAALIGPAAILAPIALVLFRGVLGDRLSELSLLFRSFYMRGAASVFLHSPVFGVGPDGFQNAYLIAKPQLSTEDVTSPHSIVFDWIATLGVLGLAWVALLFRWASGVGVGTLPDPQPGAGLEPPTPISRNEYRLIVFLPAVVTIAAAYIDSPLITPDLAVVRIGGAVLWGLCAASVLRSGATYNRGLRIALAAGALAVLAHGQIDVAFSWTQSAGFALLFIALASAGSRTRAEGSGSIVSAVPGSSWTAIVAPVAVFGLALLVLSAAYPALRWQQTLVRAADTLRPIAEFSTRLSQPKPPPEDAPERIALELSTLLNTQVAPTPTGIRAALMALESQRLPQAADLLVQARAFAPADHRPLREASRLHLRLAEAAAAGVPTGASAIEHADWAIQVLPTARDQPTAADWRWNALARDRRARLARFAEPEDVRAADIAFQHAAAADPTNPEITVRLMRLHAAAGDAQRAQIWAEETLKRDALQRYDRSVRGLNDADRAEAERLRDASRP